MKLQKYLWVAFVATVLLLYSCNNDVNVSIVNPNVEQRSRVSAGIMGPTAEVMKKNQPRKVR